MLKNSLFILSLLLFASCAGDSDSQSKGNEEEPAAEVEDQNSSGAQMQTASQAANNRGGGRYVITDFDVSTAYPEAKLEFEGYENKTFSFKVTSDSYKLGDQTPDAPQKSCANSAQGQHIHLIVNNDPYAAKYESTFEYELSDGANYILAFLSRSYHESIKTDDAHVAFFAKIRDGALMGTAPIQEPMLFYSRPKGIYQGEDTRKVMLDYYMVNANPDDYQVRADINDQTYYFKKWVPRYIEGLPAGENKIRLTLLDNEGNPVRNDMNSVERTFTLQPDPVEN